MNAARDHTAVDDDREWLRLEAAPLLGIVAAVCAVIDLALNRVAVRTLGDSLAHEELIQLSRWGELPRNLAAVCGLVALTIALVAFLRTPVHAPVRRRLSIAGFAGIFLPTTALATLLPAERTSLQIVLFATGAANVLTVLLGLTAARRAAPPGIRIGVGIMALSALLSFTALVVALVEPIAHTAAGVSTARWLRHAGEAFYLLIPLAVAVSVFPTGHTPRSRLSLAAGVIAAVTAATLMWWGHEELRAEFTVIVYGATRLEMLLESIPEAYTVPLALGFGVGVGALVSDDAARRQAGAGVLLVVAAGYAARSPSRLLMMVLGAALLARATVVLAGRLEQVREQRSEERRDQRASAAAEAEGESGST